MKTKTLVSSNKYSGKHIARPMLPISIVNPETGDSVFAWGLIDTGADSCAIPAKYAGILGHKLKTGKRIKIGTGNGTTSAFAHTTEINVFDFDSNGNVNQTGRVLFPVPKTQIHYMPKLNTIATGGNRSFR
jgi:hypothetical protein